LKKLRTLSALETRNSAWFLRKKKISIHLEIRMVGYRHDGGAWMGFQSKFKICVIVLKLEE